MAYALSDKLVASELSRAEEIAAGLPIPGQDLGTRASDTLRFPEYHEPEERWPFLADPLLKKIRKHGRHPPLLTDTGRTKGVPNRYILLSFLLILKKSYHKKTVFFSSADFGAIFGVFRADFWGVGIENTGCLANSEPGSKDRSSIHAFLKKLLKLQIVMGIQSNES